VLQIADKKLQSLTAGLVPESSLVVWLLAVEFFFPRILFPETEAGLPTINPAPTAAEPTWRTVLSVGPYKPKLWLVLP